MPKFKKGSAAAKTYMAKLRAARGKTKVVKTTTKKIGSASVYSKAPADVKKIIDKLYGNNNYLELTKAKKALEKKGYFMDFGLDGEITSFKKLPAKKVGYKPDRLKILKVSSKLIKKYMDQGYNRKEAVEMANNEASYIIQSGKNISGTKKPFNTHKDTKSHNVNIRVLSGYKQKPEIILGRVGAVTLLKSLAPEVKLRITRGKKVRSAKIITASDTAEILKKFITAAKIQTQEYSFAIYLNNANNVLAVYQFGMGGFTATIMERRLLMAAALKLGATAIILCHNHPSGNLTPSNADKVITKQISELANIHDIKVLDHVILTREGYYSFANEGLI
jgi:DNA repair protein RadC